MTDYDEQQRLAQAQAEMQEAAFQKDAAKIEELGRETFGAATFDDAVTTLASKLGDGIRTFTQIASQFDAPHQLVVSLASDEQTLDRLAKMTPARLVTELARREAAMAPNGHVPTGNEADWRKLPKGGGRMSDADWNAGLSDRLSEEQWQSQWERRQRERAGKSPQRVGSRIRG